MPDYGRQFLIMMGPQYRWVGFGAFLGRELRRLVRPSQWVRRPRGHGGDGRPPGEGVIVGSNSWSWSRVWAQLRTPLWLKRRRR
jgi:hypothetical protein